MINTVGGMIGYFIIGFIQKKIPSRQEIDEQSYQLGMYVTPLRRMVTYVVDIFLYLIFALIFHFIIFLLFLLYFSYIILLSHLHFMVKHLVKPFFIYKLFLAQQKQLFKKVVFIVDFYFLSFII